MKNIFILFLFIFLIFPSAGVFAQLNQPQTVKEARQMAEQAVETGQKELPGALERVWEGEVVPIWSKMWNVAKKPWDSLKRQLSVLWDDIRLLFGQEIRDRKPVIKGELEKEQKEFQEDVPQVKKSLWEKFKEIIR